MQHDLLRPDITGFTGMQKKLNFTIWVNKDIHLIRKTALNKASNGALGSQ